MLAIILGILFIVGGLGFGLLAFFAAGMDPAARPVSQTIGRWPFWLSAAAIALGIVILVWG